MSDINRDPHRGDQPETAEDQRLVHFLRQHRPPVPAAAADLADRLIQELPAQPLRRTRAAAWASVPVLAASALLMLQGRPIGPMASPPIVQPLSPAVRPTAETQLSEAELASLGSFLDPPSANAPDLLPLLADPVESPSR